ncbi:hypothetical protein WISP_61166 [Willisornis vidua]|uniref:Uncharacterized protein n=1 Tax=Willisornis vidua TaxID=1566151 RepID=A0ABQ9DAH2_9PASS|nr:hypothetical protein WISP_61166 [Willisornis vidua]
MTHRTEMLQWMATNSSEGIAEEGDVVGYHCICYVQSDGDPRVECLWLRIRGEANRVDTLVGPSYRPLNKNEDADKIFHDQLTEDSELLALCLMGYFNLPNVCRKYNTTETKQSRKFLECVEDTFLTQLEKQGEQVSRTAAMELPEEEFGLWGSLVYRVPWETVLKDKGKLSGKKTSLIEQRALTGLEDKTRFMTLDRIHLRVLRELVEVLTELLPIIYHQSWLTREVPDDWKLINAMSIYKKGWKEDLGICQPDLSVRKGHGVDPLECYTAQREEPGIRLSQAGPG